MQTGKHSRLDNETLKHYLNGLRKQFETDLVENEE